MTTTVAVAGAGIYGTTIAIKLAEQGCRVTLFDPLGIIEAASAINQYRVHRGYHYPRSSETIREVVGARNAFMAEFREAICAGSEHFYAMPHQGSRIGPDEFEAIMAKNCLPLEACRPRWMNFDYIARCWRVEEEIYDPDQLRRLVIARLQASGVVFVNTTIPLTAADDFDHVVYATYGSSGSHAHLFPAVRFQVAEKVLIELPASLRGLAIVVIDGPFTAFDPYGSGPYSLFGSARHTNHWETTDPSIAVPARYRDILNRRRFEPVAFTRFEQMREDCALAIPVAAQARYRGSRFTVRVVEDDRKTDQRILHIARPTPNVIHVFSGKVVSAVTAAARVSEMILGSVIARPIDATAPAAG